MNIPALNTPVSCAPPAWSAISIETGHVVGYTDLGPLLQDVIPEGVTAGLLHLFVPHTTCTLILNSGVDGTTLTDIRLFIERQIPVNTPFVHLHDGPQDAAAHVRLIFGINSLSVPISGGAVAIGESQGIYLLELDGSRTRTVQYAVSRL